MKTKITQPDAGPVFLRGRGPTSFFFALENLKIALAENSLSGGWGGAGGSEHIIFFGPQKF